MPTETERLAQLMGGAQPRNKFLPQMDEQEEAWGSFFANLGEEGSAKGIEGLGRLMAVVLGLPAMKGKETLELLDRAVPTSPNYQGTSPEDALAIAMMGMGGGPGGGATVTSGVKFPPRGSLIKSVGGKTVEDISKISAFSTKAEAKKIDQLANLLAEELGVKSGGLTPQRKAEILMAMAEQMQGPGAAAAKISRSDYIKATMGRDIDPGVGRQGKQILKKAPLNPEAMAKELGLKFQGKWDDFELFEFMDLKTKGNITVKSLDELEKRVFELRRSFERGE